MTTKNPSLEEALTAAQELMSSRLAAVEDHKRSVDAEEAAREALAARERDSSRTWAALLAAGWTAAELRKIGFTEPRAKAPGRPRGTRSRAVRDTVGTASGATDVPAQTSAESGSQAREVPTGV